MAKIIYIADYLARKHQEKIREHTIQIDKEIDEVIRNGALEEDVK